MAFCTASEEFLFVAHKVNIYELFNQIQEFKISDFFNGESKHQPFVERLEKIFKERLDTEFKYQCGPEFYARKFIEGDLAFNDDGDCMTIQPNSDGDYDYDSDSDGKYIFESHIYTPLMLPYVLARAFDLKGPEFILPIVYNFDDKEKEFFFEYMVMNTSEFSDELIDDIMYWYPNLMTFVNLKIGQEAASSKILKYLKNPRFDGPYDKYPLCLTRLMTDEDKEELAEFIIDETDDLLFVSEEDQMFIQTVLNSLSYRLYGDYPSDEERDE